MNLATAIVLFLILETCYHVSGQSPPSSGNGKEGNTKSGIVANFEPSLAVITGILSVMFTLTFVLLVYAKCCNGGQLAGGEGHNGIGGSSSRFSGIDKTVIESLPFFRFSSLKGLKKGLECAVCLSKFEDIEILRLLPKCKHAFHVGCIDEWLEQHSTCPLCRKRVTADDPSIFTYSNSLRFLNQSEVREDSNLELYVEREEEEERQGSSSRFSLGGSFRKILKKGNKEKGLFVRAGEDQEIGNCRKDDNGRVLHKFNHKIVASDVVFKNRWSNVSSSDLMFLNSEMISSMSSDRFSTLEQKDSEISSVRQSGNEGSLSVKEEMEMKRMFETKVSSIKRNDSNPVSVLGNQYSHSIKSSRIIEPGRRSMSEITGIPRFSILAAAKNRNDASSSSQIDVKEERRQRLWLPIARRTVQWFANREKRSQQSQIKTRQQLDV